jgi:tRNA A37 methylthiotransferase MiaB
MIKGLAFKDEEVKVNPLRPVTSRRILEEFTPSTSVIMDYPLFRSSRVYVEVVRGCSNYSRAMLAADTKICDGCHRCTSEDFEKRYMCPQGVPPGCGYCSVPSLFGPPRSRSTDKIVSEVKDLLSKEVKRIVLCAPDFLDYGRDLLVDPLPLTDPRHPEANYELLEELLSKLSYLDAFRDKQASFLIENIKGNLVTQKIADLLGRYLGGTAVNIGFETGSEKHSALLGRASTPKENLNAVSKLRRSGLKPYVYFIHGLPGQNLETVNATVNAINRCVKRGATRIILYRFQSLPMSAFYDQPMAPPAMKEKNSKKIYEAARKANKEVKESLVGRTMRVVVAERYDRDSRYHVAYPMLHGPVVLVEDMEGLEGKVIDVNILAVVSDRIVRGQHSDAMF